MIFKCLACGKDMESGYVSSPKLYCSKRCSNAMQRINMPLEERKAELAKRAQALRAQAQEEVDQREECKPVPDGVGIVVRCVICGELVRQVTAQPKLYCSKFCVNEQKRTHKVPAYVLGAESQKRRAAYMASLTPERKQALEYGKTKRGEYKARDAERAGLGDELQPRRHCHNYFTAVRCQNMTWDYYCPECRKKKRTGYVDQDYEETEDIWDDFSVPGSVE